MGVSIWRSGKILFTTNQKYSSNIETNELEEEECPYINLDAVKGGFWSYGNGYEKDHLG